MNDPTFTSALYSYCMSTFDSFVSVLGETSDMQESSVFNLIAVWEN